MPSLREAAVAGQFYPGSTAELEATVRQFLDGAGPPDVEKTAGAPVPKALIAPHAGYVYSGAVAAAAGAGMGALMFVPLVNRLAKHGLEAARTTR